MKMKDFPYCADFNAGSLARTQMRYRVALVPGDAFGDGKCLRLSYAATVENITDS